MVELGCVVDVVVDDDVIDSVAFDDDCSDVVDCEIDAGSVIVVSSADD